MRLLFLLALCLLAAAPAWAKRSLNECDFTVEELRKSKQFRFERAEIERDRVYTLMGKYDGIFKKLKEHRVGGLSDEESNLIQQALNTNWDNLQDSFNAADTALANAKDDLSAALDLTEAQHKAECKGQ